MAGSKAIAVIKLTYWLLLLSALLVPPHSVAAFDRTDYLTVIGAQDVPLNVVAVGPVDAPGILFIHGIGQSHLSWERQLASDLADRFRLVAFDLRGHGNSGKPWNDEAYDNTEVWAEDLNNVIAATQLESPVLVAWSYGTLVALDYVRHYGTDDIAALNLVGAYGGLITAPPADPDEVGTQEFASLRKLQASPDLRDNIEASRGMVRWLTARSMSDDWYDRAAMIGLMLPRYARVSMLKRPFDTTDLIDALDILVLLSVGAQDGGTPVSMGEELVTKVSGMSLSVYTDAGHSPFLEDWERFNVELATLVEDAN